MDLKGELVSDGIQHDPGPAIEWTHPGLHLRFDHGDDRPVRLVHWATGPDALSVAAPSPIVDVSTAGEWPVRLPERAGVIVHECELASLQASFRGLRRGSNSRVSRRLHRDIVIPARRRLAAVRPGEQGC
jgi:hypothetical protein